MQNVDKGMPALIYIDNVKAGMRLLKEGMPSAQVVLNDLAHGMMRITKFLNDIPVKGG